MQRTPFYPFTRADATRDPDFAAFLASAARRPAPGLSLPPGLGPPAGPCGVAGFVEWRARSGHDRPQPPLSAPLLAVLDALLGPEARARPSASDAAQSRQ